MRGENGSRVRIAAAGCRTAFGDAATTHSALLRNERALQMLPVTDYPGADCVPLALANGRSLLETNPPDWMPVLRSLGAEIPHGDWGGPRTPVFLTSSNFGVGRLYAFFRTHDSNFLRGCTPAASVEQIRLEMGWGENVTVFSHACVSAHLGLLAAAREISAGGVERALIFSFDFLSPFVAGGFHALKILNDGMPAPYQARGTGSIALGDGAAFAVLARAEGNFEICAQSLYNEMQHFTSNQADGSGFQKCLAPMGDVARSHGPFWIKGHGTGTIEAGRLEAETLHALFPGIPLVSWKGSLGHTLGSCGLVELALALQAIVAGRVPGTVGSESPFFAPNVAQASFSVSPQSGVLLTSNAFGGAHAACFVAHV